MTIPKLTETRKADRAEMARQVEALAKSLGVTIEREDEGTNSICPRRIHLSLTGARGLRLGVEFDGKSPQPDVYVCSWCIDVDSDACFSGSFSTSVNPYHFAKATHVAYGFDALMSCIRMGFERANDGTAFDADREAEKIAKNGGETAADRAAKWAKWRAEWNQEREASQCSAS